MTETRVVVIFISAVKNSILKKIYTFSIAFLEWTISKKNYYFFKKKERTLFFLFTLIRVCGSSSTKTSGYTGKEPETNSMMSQNKHPYSFLWQSDSFCPSACAQFGAPSPCRPAAEFHARVGTAWVTLQGLSLHLHRRHRGERLWARSGAGQTQVQGRAPYQLGDPGQVTSSPSQLPHL